ASNRPAEETDMKGTKRTRGVPRSASWRSQLAILPTDVKLITKPEDLYQWSILTAGKAALFNKQLSNHSTGAYIDLCNGIGVHFKAMLAEGAANYEQETRLTTISAALNAPCKSENIGGRGLGSNYGKEKRFKAAEIEPKYMVD
ncbi:hypothetical protein V500_00122, partial [Pseudogymnoascus sp. VKM F-4518 (FW-2643)]